MSEEKNGRVGTAHAESNEQTVTSAEELADLKEVNAQQAAEIERLKGEIEQSKTTAKQSLTVPPDVPKLEASATLKTQGVKPSRDRGVGVLQSAAKKAARTNSRSDVHEYMRLRRGYV